MCRKRGVTATRGFTWRRTLLSLARRGISKPFKCDHLECLSSRYYSLQRLFVSTIDNIIEAIVCCSIHLQAEVSLPSSGEKLGHTRATLKPGDYFGFGEGLLKDC